MAADRGERAVPDHLVVGHISKPHGNRGELFVWPLTDRADDVFVPGRSLLLGDEDAVVADDAAAVVVGAARPFKRGLLVRFEDCETREDAEALARRYLLLAIEDVPPLEEGEVFYHQLLGMAVVTVAGDPVGHVCEVYDTEPHHLLDVQNESGRRHLVPFAERIVRSVDVEAGAIVIDPPAGLLDL